MKSIVVTLAAFLIFVASSKALAASTESAMFTIGDIKITALQDASGNMPISIFHGAPEAEINKLAPSGSIPASVNVFLLQQEKRNILIDTGNGPGKGALLTLLAKQGLKPDDITDILLTHMHGDHIGGLIDGETPVYPKAKIRISAPELYYWTENAAPGFEATANQAKAVQKAYGDRLTTFQFGTRILPDIQGLASVGHTPGHTMYLLTVPGKTNVVYSGKNMGHGAAVEKDQQILFWGDLLHSATIQFPIPEVCAKYDMNVAEAVDARKTVMKMAADKKIPVAGAHLPFPGIGQVQHEGRAFKFVPGL